MSHDKVRFVTVAGNVDMDILPDQPFNMAEQMTNLRGAGYLMHETVYLPLSSILAVFTFDSRARGGVTLSSDRGKLN